MAENTHVEFKVTLSFKAPDWAEPGESAAMGWAARRAEFWHEFERRNHGGRLYEPVDDAVMQKRERQIKSEVAIRLEQEISHQYKDKITASTIDDLKVFIKRIDYGSIELYVVIFGVLKLLNETGITMDDFKTGIEVLTPIAMQLGLNTPDVTFDENAATLDNVAAREGVPSPESQTVTWSQKLLANAKQATLNTFYLIPGVLLFAAAYFLIVSASQERRDLIQAISADRKQISDEFASVVRQKEGQRLNELKALMDMEKTANDQIVRLATEKDDQRAKLFDLQYRYLNETSNKIMARETAEPGTLKMRNEPQVALFCPGAPSGPLAVMSGQLVLRIRGPYALAIDGRLGGATKKALLEFQRGAGLPQSGAFDVATLKALGIGCPQTKVEAASSGTSTP